MAGKENCNPAHETQSSTGPAKKQKTQEHLTIGSVLRSGDPLKKHIKSACGKIKDPLGVSTIKPLLLLLERRPYEDWTIEELQLLVAKVAPAVSVKANGDHEGMLAYGAVTREAGRLVSEVPEARELLDPTYLLLDTPGLVPAAHTAVIASWPPVDGAGRTRYTTTITYVPGSSRLMRLTHANPIQLQQDKHALCGMLYGAGATRMFVFDLPLPVEDYP